jgi:hypothetical protein
VLEDERVDSLGLGGLHDGLEQGADVSVVERWLVHPDVDVVANRLGLDGVVPRLRIFLPLILILVVEPVRHVHQLTGFQVVDDPVGAFTVSGP